MLLQFSVGNYRSILERQTLNMAASNYFKEREAANTFDSGLGGAQPRLLHANVVYGPNASGKSTLVRALGFMQKEVINSAKSRQTDEEIDVEPFKLAAASREGDSEFEIAFVEDGVRYQYGFTCNRQRFTEEWLFAHPSGRPQKWFHRAFDPKKGEDAYRFSASFQGGRKRQDWKEQTRANALFLSTALQLNNAQLRPVLDWFQKRLRINKSSIVSGFALSGYTRKRCRNDEYKRKVLNFLQAADLSISDLRIDTHAFSAEELPADMPEALREEICQAMAGEEVIEATFLHQDVETGEPIEFGEADESDGTRTLFAFAGPWLDVLENDHVLVIDEMEANLHPLLVRHMVDLMQQPEHKAQLVATTHDATLLGSGILRRDQIWFLEKNERQASELYPLSDFKPRSNEAVEARYLSGRYGGIPILKELDLHGVG